MMFQPSPASLNPSPGRLRIGIFPATAKPGLRQQALRAFATSLSRAGHDMEWVEAASYRTCNLAVIYGFPGLGGQGRRHAVRQSITAAHKRTVLIVETPLFGRKVPALKRGILPFIIRRPDETFDRFRVSLNGCFWDDGIFCNEPTEAGRWSALRKELGLEVKDYRKHGEHLLLAGQVPGDASLRGVDILGWMENTARELADASDRPIVIRPHPRSDHNALASMMRRLQTVRRIAWDVKPGGSLRDSLTNAWATVTFSSGAAIDSLLMGIPAISMCPSSMAWPVTDHDIQKVNLPTLYDRHPWLDQLAHSQWTIAEIESGAVWARFETSVFDLVSQKAGPI